MVPADEDKHADRRKYPRRRYLWSATLSQGDGDYSCVVLDVSSGGAKIRLSNAWILTSAAVKISCAQLGSVTGIVAWQRGTLAGIKFSASRPRFGRDAVVESNICRTPPIGLRNG